MADFSKVEKALKERGYTVKVFATGAEAAAYLDGEIDGATVGIGGCATAQELGLYMAGAKRKGGKGETA